MPVTFARVPRAAHSALATVLALLGALLAPVALDAQESPSRRPMTFLDMQKMRQVGAQASSPDGRWLLYTLSTPDWQEAKRQTDIYLEHCPMQLSTGSPRQFPSPRPNVVVARGPYM